MVRKVKSFAQKMQKKGIEVYQKCAICSQNLIPHKVISSEFADDKGSYKFPTKKVLICKCNEKDFFAN